MSLVFRPIRWEPDIPHGYRPTPINFPPRDSLEQLEIELAAYLSPEVLVSDIEITCEDTDTGKFSVVRAPRLDWPSTRSPEELEQVRKNRLSVLRRGSHGD